MSGYGRLIAGLVLIGTILLLQSCATVGVNLPLPPPVLSAAPRLIPCSLDKCVVVSEKDWREVVLTLKAYCLALGGSDEICGTNDP